MYSAKHRALGALSMSSPSTLHVGRVVEAGSPAGFASSAILSGVMPSVASFVICSALRLSFDRVCSR